jgi:peptidoglycan/LPS O-acetylase OafA/YrhL
MSVGVKKFEYIPSLDGIRAFAVIGVLLLHGSYGFIKGGWVGVDLFFVLSGYLITTLLQHEYATTGRVLFINFYVRRVLRLFPALVLCVLLTNLLWQYAPENKDANQFVSNLASLFYFSDILPTKYLGTLAPLWSLSVEEHFYLLWPIVLTGLLFVVSPRSRATLLLVVIVAIVAFRIYAFNHSISYGLLFIDSYRFTFCRFDSILLGAGLALFLKDVRPVQGMVPRANLALAIIGLLFLFVLLFVFHENKYLANGGFILTNLLCLATVYTAVKFPTHPVLANKLFRWISHRSYGIYLYHYAIFRALESLREPHSLLNIVLITLARIVLTFVIAELSFRFIEQPILKYKDRFQAVPNRLLRPSVAFAHWNAKRLAK